MHPDSIQARKPELRKILLARRHGLGEAGRSVRDPAILARLQELEEVRGANSVFCYISHGHEPDTRRLLEWLLERGKQVFVPRVIQKGLIDAVAYTGWDDVAPGPLGIPAPASSAAARVGMDVTITPGIGYTRRGGRLGHGAGYYDRWFAAHEAGVKIAPAYECQLHDDIPVQAHDVPVDIIVTEDRVIDTRSPATGRA